MLTHPAGATETADPSELPAWLRTALDQPALARKAWVWSVAPTYIGLFLWAAFFDQFPAETLRRGPLAAASIGAAIGGLLAYLLFYQPAALWGFRTGRPMSVLATRTFGVRGAVWVPGLLIGLANVAWNAVATAFGTGFCLMGLVGVGLLEPRYLSPWTVGGVTLVSPLFVAVSLSWCVAASLVGRWLVRVIAALMSIYPVLPGLLLGAAVLAAFRGLGSFRSLEVPSMTQGGPEASPWAAAAFAVQMVLGFFAAAGLGAGDWGAAVRTPRDVREGGLVSVAFAAWIVATLSLLTVAGTLGRFGLAGSRWTTLPAPMLSFHATLGPLFGQRVAGGMLLALGLTALAPAVFSAYLFGHRFHDAFPRTSRTRWTLRGIALSWPLVITGLAFRLADVFSLVGALLAPALGALAADYLLSRGQWQGARLGVNRPGLIAWAVGAALGVAGVAAGRAADRFQPLALWAFLAAFVVYLVATAAGLTAPADARVPLDPPLPAAGPGED